MHAVLTLLVSAALIGSATAQQAEGPLAEAVKAALENADLDDQVAEIVVDGETVTLRGKPQNAYVKMKAIETALAVPGIEAVEDELDVAAAESDEDFAKDLVSSVLTYPRYTVFDDIGFQLQDGGLVVLTGSVTDPLKKTEIEQRVGSVTGVQELKSIIEVLPPSQTDDRLRETLFRNIYGHELFEQYARRTHPPIRIIVNSSSVTLSGAVRNKIEKIQAESITRSTFGVIQVDNRLQVNP